MKTLEQLYNEVMASEELKAEFTLAARDRTAAAKWLEKQGCDATIEQVADYLKTKGTEQGELVDSDVEAVAGGSKNRRNGDAAVISIFSVGIGCGIMAAVSKSKGRGPGTHYMEIRRENGYTEYENVEVVMCDNV